METNFDLLKSIYDKMSYNTQVKTTVVEDGVLKTASTDWAAVLSTVRIIEADVIGELLIDCEEMNFAELEEYLSEMLYIAPLSEEQIPFYFPKLKKYLNPYLYIGNYNTVSFPMLELVNEYEFILANTDDVEEVHFRADMQDYFEAHPSYEEKFGCPNATIVFDL